MGSVAYGTFCSIKKVGGCQGLEVREGLFMGSEYETQVIMDN